MTSARAPSGLSSDEARRRQLQHGRNDIGEREQRRLWRTMLSVAQEPMFLLLLVAAGIYLVIGDLGEGLLLAFFALMTVALVVVQAHRSERALDALRELAVPMARVVRDGVVQRIAASELVPGDVFMLGEGERIPADAVAREASSLVLDESLLTGESVPVRKTSSAETVSLDQARPGGDDLPFIYAGTLVVAGHGIAEVLATGKRTRLGGIGASLAAIDTAATPLEVNLNRLVRYFAIGALATSVWLALWYGLQRGEWLQGVLAGIALGMAMLPEEFPMALVVFLALGAWRMAKSQVLARRPAVIEALGAVTVLCVDKTGTLTHNRITLRRLVSADADVDVSGGGALPESVRPLLEFAMLASRRSGIDPMDSALLSHGDRSLLGTAHLHPNWRLEQEYPLTPELLAMSQAWMAEDRRQYVAAKGAPEAIAGLCHLDAAARQTWLRRVHALAEQGLRVLAVALAHGAGIAVVMITGDHAATALAIARQAGIDTAGGVLTGDDLERLDAAALADAVRTVRVFARVMPEQKLHLVQAFGANGHTVAMTGDGVNDAPALKAAHVGIAMGARGTDVAREAAGLVLLDEEFSRIVAGVRMGRHIFDNLRRVMTYITAIHVPIAGLALLPVLFGLPPLMLPVHVVLTEMVIDPVCSLAFERAPEDPRTMQRPPRDPRESLIGWPMVWQGLVQGGALLLVALAIYDVGLRAGMGADTARTLAIVALTAGNLLLVLVNASVGAGWRALLDKGFAMFWWVAGIASAVLVVAIVLPGPRRLLHFGVPSWQAMATAVACTVAAVALAASIRRLTTWRAAARTVAAPTTR
jgi:P-type Ca2+ transporter type 2C